MSVIDGLLESEAAQWIVGQIDNLPNRAKFRAFNSLRSLQWASRIYDAGMPIPACFCALHATEEAVASFVSCAKVSGYSAAKQINIHDHRAKSVVSLMAQKVSEMMAEFKLAVAVDKKTDTLALRFMIEGVAHYRNASASVFHFRDEQENFLTDFYEELVGTFENIDALRNAVERGQIARNEIFYASSNGYPSGFVYPEASLKRECQISIGLIWAALDVDANKSKLIPLIQQSIQTTNLVIAQFQK